MNIKKADPEASPKDTDTNHIKIRLSPTQSRIVKLLLIAPHRSYDVEQKAYCRYAADNIQHLRAKGLEIITTMVDYVRQVDNKTVKVGEYSIAPQSIDLARRSVGYGA